MYLQKGIALFVFCATVLQRSCEAYNNGMGRTPPMGWNSWCTKGASGAPSLCNALGDDPCSDSLVRETADAIIDQGLDKLGYTYVALDDCWSDTARDANGNLQPDTKRFPNGMKAIADYVHSKGLLFGVYTSLGAETCKGHRPGSYGHYAADASTLASWGVDLVKMDHCGHRNGTDTQLYGEMSKALNSTGRPILFSLCNWGESSVWSWGASVAQMYRVQMDHLPLWSAAMGGARTVGDQSGTYDIIEWMAHLQPSKWTRPYGYMDPDFLMTEYPLTMDATASRTEFTFWSLWSAPMLVATDIRSLSPTKRAILANEEVIAVNQDPSGTAGDRVHKGEQGDQVWARDLAGGDKCVVLYNSQRRAGTDLEVRVSWDMVGWLATDDVQVRDLWSRVDLGNFTAGFNATLTPRDVRMLRLKRT